MSTSFWCIVCSKKLVLDAVPYYRANSVFQIIMEVEQANIVRNYTSKIWPGSRDGLYDVNHLDVPVHSGLLEDCMDYIAIIVIPRGNNGFYKKYGCHLYKTLSMATNKIELAPKEVIR